MGKKYYCDYCDASFPDSKEGRKKHNLGLVHQRMKEAHFKQFTDSRMKLAQELQKTPCRRFLQGFPCKFGDDCRFSHLLPHEIDQLRYAAEMEEKASIKFPSQLLKKDQPPIEDFVKKVEQLVREKEMASDKSSLWLQFEIEHSALDFLHYVLVKYVHDDDPVQLAVPLYLWENQVMLRNVIMMPEGS